MELIASLCLVILIMNKFFITAFAYFCIFYYLECTKINVYTCALMALSFTYSFSYTVCVSTLILWGGTYIWMEIDETEMQTIKNAVKLWMFRIFLCIKHAKLLCSAYINRHKKRKVQKLDEMKTELAESNSVVDAVLNESE